MHHEDTSTGGFERPRRRSKAAPAAAPLLVLLAVLVGCCAVFLSALFPRPARASGEPVPTVSRYMSTTNSQTLYNEGCAMGNKTGIVVLDFGEPWYANGAYGTITYANSFASTAAIENAAKSFLQGYWYCTPSSAPYVRLGLGTSNYGGYVGSGQGRAWAAMVNDLNGWLHTKGWDGQESARGANDMEPSWNSPSATRGWVDAYASTATGNSYYYDYGSADGCPPYGGCTNGWTQEDLWYVSWGAWPAYPTPELYYYANAQQWYRAALYGYTQHGYAEQLLSTFTEHAADSSTYAPQQAWDAVEGMLNSDSRTTQTIPFSTDITFGN